MSRFPSRPDGRERSATGRARRRWATLLGLAWLLLAGGAPATAAEPARGPRQPRQTAGLAILGTEIGYGGMEPLLLPGRTELVLTTSAGTGFWYTVASDGNGGYRTAFVGENVGPFLRGVSVLPPPLTSRRAGRLYLADSTGTVHVLDAEDKSLQALIELERLPGSTFRKVVAVDLTGDGVPEFVTTSSALCVHDSGGFQLWCESGLSGADLVIGQMDRDPSLEIATSEGWVVDVDSRQRQWQFSPFFTGDLEAADLDGDGNLELIGSPSSVRAWDVEEERELWMLPGADDRDAIAVGNFDQDAALEVAFQGPGGLRAYDTSSLLEEWTIPGGAFGSRDFALVDLDRDGRLELVFGVGAGSSGPDFLWVVDAATGAIEWQSLSLDGPILGPQLADVDCDGRRDLVLASGSSNSGGLPGWILLLDPVDLSRRAATRIEDPHARRALGLTARDVDGDGCAEVLVAGGDGFQAVLEAWSYGPGSGFQRDWTNDERPPGVKFVSIDAVDLNADRTADLFVAGVDPETTGSEGVFLYAYSAADGHEVWRSEDFGRVFAELSGVDADDDGELEIVALGVGAVYPFTSSLGDLFVFDALSGALEARVPGDFTALEVVAVAPRSAPPRLRLAGNDGRLSTYSWDGRDYSLLQQIALTEGRIEGFTVAGGTVWFGSDRRLHRYREGTVDWTSGRYDTFFGWRLAAPTPGAVIASGRYAAIRFAAPEEP